MSTNLAKLQLIAMGIPFVFGGDNELDPNPLGGNGQTPPSPNNMPPQVQSSDDEDLDGEEDDEEWTEEEKLQNRLDKIKDPKARRIAEVSAENASKRREIKALKAQLRAEQAAKTKAANKESSTAEALQTELDQARADNEAMQGTLRKTLLENAIRGYSKIEWHDTSDVMRAIDSEEVTVDVKTGKIEGLPSELRRIAREKPHFVKTSVQDESDPANGSNGKVRQNNNQGGAQQQPSGVTPGAPGRATDRTSARRAELEKLYPVLKR